MPRRRTPVAEPPAVIVEPPIQGPMTIQQKALALILSILRPAVALRTTLPITQSVLLGQGRAAATNLECSVVVESPHLAGDWSMAVSRALLSKMVEALPPGELILTRTEVKSRPALKLASSQGFTATLLGNDPSEFPPLTNSLVLPNAATAYAEFLIPALKRAAGFAAADESRPMLHGVLLELGKESKVVAADGFRLAVIPVEFRIRDNSKEAKLILPLSAVHALSVISKLVPGAGALELEYNGLQARFRLQAMGLTVTLTSNLIQGQFSEYAQLIPPGFHPGVTFQAQELCALVKALAPVAREGANIIRLQWDNSQIRALARSGDFGKASGAIPCQATGEGMTAYDYKYLLDVLGEQTGEVRWGCQSPSRPGRFDLGGATMVVMPMFVQW